MFHKSADNIDDLMRAVFARLLSGNRDNNRVCSKKGRSTEVFGALLQLTNPRARLGRSIVRSRVYSSIGELVWYLSASNSLVQIQYYIPGYGEFSDGKTTLYGAYGPRIFSPARTQSGAQQVDEWQRVVDLLKERSGSRKAVIQIFSNADGKEATDDVPCTCTIQFALRRKRLEAHVHMRSNDAFLGLPHDIFSFTMMQEIAARELGVDVGKYQHSVASLHLYDDNEDPTKLQSRTLAQRYLDEELYDTVPMPAMPSGDPWAAIQELVHAESQLRQGNLEYAAPGSLDPYWSDLITLLRAHAIAARGGQAADLEGLLAELHFAEYRLYILDRMARKRQPAITKDLFKNDGNDTTRGA